MIIGTGIDLIDIGRIEKALDRFGARFTHRCFTAAERAKADRRKETGTRAATYAKRFAAKEACAKALGTGFSNGVFFKDIGVSNDPAGKPVLTLTGGALLRLAAITPVGKTAILHLALTDEPPTAQAIVTIEAV